ncbi:hypothetical protein COU54_01295 [Candidatus Pacearchaeota archaeon CG10_big_fil_rev_8_21_14_0_10_31_24]|nr:MAG: hypothetical protein COU54_01295 [Candidatus Pacearchaeota archaeon CG10_big_fil_rev_8_21_14_0_10_31_24]
MGDPWMEDSVNLDLEKNLTRKRNMSLVRKNPAKSVESLHPISDETRAIILRETGKDCQYAYQLPERLVLYDCPDLIDASALGDVKELYLTGCTNVTDVSMLGGVQYLSLWGCTKVTDVSMLGGVIWLSLRNCTGITDVSMLGGVKELDLRACTGITDFSMVPHAIK